MNQIDSSYQKQDGSYHLVYIIIILDRLLVNLHLNK
jgi:hypothetical protein